MALLEAVDKFFKISDGMDDFGALNKKASQCLAQKGNLTDFQKCAIELSKEVNKRGIENLIDRLTFSNAMDASQEIIELATKNIEKVKKQILENPVLN